MLIGFAEIKQGRMARAGGDKSFDEGANIPARNIKLRLILATFYTVLYCRRLIEFL